jgi:hypothetical protein
MEKPIEMDDLGVPLFLGNLHMGKVKHNPLELEAMWVKRVKQCHKPPMTGNGLYIPPIKMVMTGGWFMKLFYPHLLCFVMTLSSKHAVGQTESND